MFRCQSFQRAQSECKTKVAGQSRGDSHLSTPQPCRPFPQHLPLSFHLHPDAQRSTGWFTTSQCLSLSSCFQTQSNQQILLPSHWLTLPPKNDNKPRKVLQYLHEFTWQEPEGSAGCSLNLQVAVKERQCKSHQHFF